MKRILIALFTLLYIGVLSLQAHEHSLSQVKDSLLRIYLASPPDSSRLEVLHYLARLDQQTPTFIYYENKLLQEAIAQKNIKYQSTATYDHIIYYYNKLDQKHVEQWLLALEQLAERNNYYTDYFKGKKMLIELYTINQKIELAINEANDMYKRAKKLNNRDGMRVASLCLMTNYFASYRYKEGIAQLNRAFELTHPDDPSMEMADLQTKAVLAYSFLHNNDKLFQHLKLLEKAKDRLVAESRPMLSNGYFNLYMLIEIQYALFYIRDKQPEQAWIHLQKAEEYVNSNTFLPYQLTRLIAYADYYDLVNEKAKAMDNLDKAIAIVTPISPEDAITYSAKKANLLVEMGDSDQALPIYKEIMRVKDSLYTSMSTSQMKQIQSLYNMDKLLLQKERRQTMYQYICLVAAGIILLSLLLFIIQMYLSNRRLKKDEQEMRRLTAVAEEANEVKSRFLANMSYNIRIPLNNVVGFSQLLSTETGLDEIERHEYSSIIQANSKELIQLVNDVLDLSRLEANMMKFQLQDYSVEEWCSELSCMIGMRSEGQINLKLHAQVEGVRIHTDINRLTQIVINMLLCPNECKEVREVVMTLTYDVDRNELSGRVENSPLVAPEFSALQKVSVQQKINQLFFEHFGGIYRIEETSSEAPPVLVFTYPAIV